MFKLVLLRHGESIWNWDNRLNKYYLGEDKKVKEAIEFIANQHKNKERINHNV
jgi:hypothetical protein